MDDKIEDKKRLLLDAAMKEFSRNGFHNAKISKIAEISGIGAGTVYLYFKSKEQILEEIFINAWSVLEEKLINLNKDNSINCEEKLKLFLENIIDLISNKKDLASVILHENMFWSTGKSQKVAKHVDNTKAAFISLIEHGMEDKIFRTDLIPEMAIHYIIGALWNLLAFWVDNYEKYEIKKIKFETIYIVLNCLKKTIIE